MCLGAPLGPFMALLGCRGSNEGECVGCAIGHLRGLESSIFAGEGRSLDHPNRLLTARIATIDDILKALKKDFYDFLSCFRTHFYAVLYFVLYFFVIRPSIAVALTLHTLGKHPECAPLERPTLSNASRGREKREREE